MRFSRGKLSPGMPLVVRQRTMSVFSLRGSTTLRMSPASWVPISPPSLSAAPVGAVVGSFVGDEAVTRGTAL